MLFLTNHVFLPLDPDIHRDDGDLCFLYSKLQRNVILDLFQDLTILLFLNRVTFIARSRYSSG